MAGDIPTLDLSWYQRKNKSYFAQEFGEAMEHFGFVRMLGHGVPRSVLDNAASAAEQFFALPMDEKIKHHVPGYTGIMSYTVNGEIARGQTVPDDKQEWCIRLRLPPGDPLAPKIEGLLTVDSVPAFKPAMKKLCRSFEAATVRLMRPLVRYMGEDEKWLDDKFDRAYSTARILHYPSGGGGAKHKDLNLITWLRTDREGLFVEDRTGTVHAIEPQHKDELIINSGYMMEMLTHGVMVASPHWVETDKPRHTIVYFSQPNPDFKLHVLPKYRDVDFEYPDYFPPRSADGVYEPIRTDQFVDGALGGFKAAEAMKAGLR